MSRLYRLPDEILRIIFEYSHNMMFRDVVVQFLKTVKWDIVNLDPYSPYPISPWTPSVSTSILIFKNEALSRSAVGWRYVYNRRTNDMYVHDVTVMGRRSVDSFMHTIGKYPGRFSFVEMKNYDKKRLHDLCEQNGLPHRSSYARDKLVTYLLKQPD